MRHGGGFENLSVKSDVTDTCVRADLDLIVNEFKLFRFIGLLIVCLVVMLMRVLSAVVVVMLC